MALTNMQFTKDWRDPVDFPTIENSEIQVRADIQILYDELAANINTNIAKLQATASGESGASNIGVSGITGFAGTTIQSVIEAIGTAVTTTAAETYSKTEADAKYQTKTASDELLKSITFDPDDGSFTITTQGGLVTTIDTDIEKIPVSVSIIQSGSTYKLRITNEDGTYSECDVSALFNAVNFVNSETIAFTQTTNADGSKTVSGSIRPGSVTESMLEDDFRGDITGLVHDAQTAATNAAASESNAASSETNAAQSALEAANSESDAANYAIEARSYARGGTGSRAGENTDNAKYYKEQTFAKADIAEQYRLDAEAYARGTRDGDAVGPSDPTYHNNSKYYSEQSAASALSSAQSSSSAAQSAADALADKNAAAGSATAAAGSATAAAGSATAAAGSATAAAGSASAASTSETNAANSASAAAASAASVGTQASDAEAAARGTRNGVPVGPDDEFYNDNAEYYKDQAAAIVGPQQPKITATGILKGEGDGVVSAAVAGTDYVVTETDPTVPAWAKAATKPTYTAAEVGALPSSTAIPSKTSDLTNDSGFITAASPALTGTPTAPTPTSTSDATQIATKEYVDGHTPDMSAYMQKGVDYVTAGQKSGTTLGDRATAEGYNTTASDDYSHAEGNGTKASGYVSHAEGTDTTASGAYSHSEGCNTTASGMDSHAEGFCTTAQRKSQHVFGEYNVLDITGTNTTRGTYVEIVGKGTSSSARSNARTLDWSGNEVLAGKLTVGAGPTNNMDVATKQYVDSKAGLEVFKVTYNVTSYADVLAEYQNPSGKPIVLFDGNDILPLIDWKENEDFDPDTGVSLNAFRFRSCESKIELFSNNTWRKIGSGVVTFDCNDHRFEVSGFDAFAQEAYDYYLEGKTVVFLNWPETGRRLTVWHAYLVAGTYPEFLTIGSNINPTSDGELRTMTLYYESAENEWDFIDHAYAPAIHSHDLSYIKSGSYTNCIVMTGSSATAGLTTRVVTNNTATSKAISANTNIPTMNTLRFAINRTTSVAAADTGYTTYMARGEALNSADANPTVNGAISWTYA